MPALSYAVIALAIVAMLWPSSPPTTRASLAGSQWRVVEIGGVKISGTLRFTHTTIRGRAHCNAYLGAFREYEDGIKIAGINATRRHCEGRMEREQELIESLGRARTYRVDGDRLLLMDADGNAVARLAG